MKLDVKAFTLASGTASGISSLVVVLFAVLTGRGLQFLEIIAAFHPGYTPTVLGAVISAIWMLIYGLIVGALFAYVYNSFAKK
ncbi:hypothetical protein [Methanosarcina sp.]|uniref:hypothetical protein n=1 Tax=Methanosarcina sp. TaxID=2213 RepID=UPI002ABA0F81|nr:hypothetical protein [Methanosarcina sp.]MDY9928005.1 hypothetical protein [Methanosarcina sp.]